MNVILKMPRPKKVSQPDCDVVISSQKSAVPDDSQPTCVPTIKCASKKVSEADCSVCAKMTPIKPPPGTKPGVANRVSTGGQTDVGYETGMDMTAPLDDSASNARRSVSNLEPPVEEEEVIMDTQFTPNPPSPPMEMEYSQVIECQDQKAAAQSSKEDSPVQEKADDDDVIESPDQIIEATQVTPTRSARGGSLPRLPLSSGRSAKPSITRSVQPVKPPPPPAGVHAEAKRNPPQSVDEVRAEASPRGKPAQPTKPPPPTAVHAEAKRNPPQSVNEVQTKATPRGKPAQPSEVVTPMITPKGKTTQPAKSRQGKATPKQKTPQARTKGELLFFKSKNTVPKTPPVNKRKANTGRAVRGKLPAVKKSKTDKTVDDKTTGIDKTFASTVNKLLEKEFENQHTSERDCDENEVPDTMEKSHDESCNVNVSLASGNGDRIKEFSFSQLQGPQKVLRVKGKQALAPKSFYSKRIKPNPPVIPLHDPYDIDLNDSNTRPPSSVHARNNQPSPSSETEFHLFESQSNKRSTSAGRSKGRGAKSKQKPPTRGKQKSITKRAVKFPSPPESPHTTKRQRAKQTRTTRHKVQQLPTSPIKPKKKAELPKPVSLADVQRSMKLHKPMEEDLMSLSSFGISECSVRVSPLGQKTVKEQMNKKPRKQQNLPTPQNLQTPQTQDESRDAENLDCSQWSLPSMSQMSVPSQSQYKPPSTRNRFKIHVEKAKQNLKKSGKLITPSLDVDKSFTQDVESVMDMTVSQTVDTSVLPMSENESMEEIHANTSRCESADTSRTEVSAFPGVMSSVQDMKKDIEKRCSETKQIVARLTQKPTKSISDKVGKIVAENKLVHERLVTDMSSLISEETSQMNDDKSEWDSRMTKFIGHMKKEAGEIKRKRLAQLKRRQVLTRKLDGCFKEMTSVDAKLLADLHNLEGHFTQERVKLRNSLIRGMQQRDMDVIKRNMEKQLTTWLG